jgi:hypothetical protein
MFSNSVEQNPCETDGCSASQEIPSLLWNWKFHFRNHKSPPPYSVLIQMKPVHILTPN